MSDMNWPDAVVSIVLIIAVAVIWLAYLWRDR